MKTRISVVVILGGLALLFPDTSRANIVEGFTPALGGYQPFDEVAKQSAETGFTWAHSGAHSFVALGEFGSNVLDWGNGCCNPPAGDYVFTIFSTTGTSTLDTSLNLGAIEFVWTGNGSGLIRALIRDDSGAWFLSDDTAGSVGTTSINALTTTWTEVVGASALTALNTLTTDADIPLSGGNLGVAGAGTPNLENVNGGGYFWQTAPVGTKRTTLLTFVEHVPEPSTFLLGILAMFGIGSFGWRTRKRV